MKVLFGIPHEGIDGAVLDSMWRIPIPPCKSFVFGEDGCLRLLDPTEKNGHLLNLSTLPTFRRRKFVGRHVAKVGGRLDFVGAKTSFLYQLAQCSLLDRLARVKPTLG